MKYRGRSIDHLGLIAAMCDELDIVKSINQRVGDTKRKISVGHAVKAMIINALGFTGRALYLTPNFYRNKSTDILIGDRINPLDLNDDSLGDALDRLYKAGLNETFFVVSSQALRTQKIDHKFAHLDSTTFSTYGTYAEYYNIESTENEDEKDPIDDSQVVEITKGYSKDNAPELNQVVVHLITTYKSSIPIWINSANGNASDKKTFPAVIQQYKKNLQGAKMPCMVMDSAFYTKKNITECGDFKWITRVPETISSAVNLLETTSIDSMSELENGYRILSKSASYAGVQHRWLLVYSQKAYERELETLHRVIDKREQGDMSRLNKIKLQEFACEADANAALDSFAKSLKYHILTCRSVQVQHSYTGKGRPAKDEKPTKSIWKVNAILERDQQLIDKAASHKGRFIIATNELSTDEISDCDMLSIYKSQGVSVERGFRFLKDPLFYAESFYLKSPTRIMALIMIMGISLLVYSLLERKIRMALKEEQRTIHSQTGKAIDNPTIRWIFMLFEDMTILEIERYDKITRELNNPLQDHLVILDCLGPHFKNMYCVF